MTLEELQSAVPFIQWKKFIESYLGNGFKLEGSDVVILNNGYYFKNLAEVIAETPAR
jgi:hypothetical protein